MPGAKVGERAKINNLTFICESGTSQDNGIKTSRSNQCQCAEKQFLRNLPLPHTFTTFAFVVFL